MRSLRTIIASAAAVALVVLAITIAPAIATNAPSATGPDPSAQDLRSCLADHGAEVPDGDALALKRWLGQHRDDAAVRDAMEACRLAIATKPAGGVAQPNPSSATNAPSANGPDPSAQKLRSCLADHGAEVPDGGALALKRWLVQHGDDAAVRDAMKACRLAIKPAIGVEPSPGSD